MPDFEKPERIIVTCSKRLSSYLEMEIRELGLDIVRCFATGVELAGSLNDCIRLNLNLRCASQVLFSLQSFACNNPDQLYNTLSKIAWEDIIAKDGYFSVTSFINHPTINNSLFANVKVKDAIVDRFRTAMNTRPDSGPQLESSVIHLYWNNDNAELFIDTSGETLSKHGYRKIPGRAPMMESLAAATLLATNWNKTSTVVNPMCGSGTIAIEAGMIATNRRPGLFRNNYGFMHIIGFNKDFYDKEKALLSTQIKEVPGLAIIATDINSDAINISRINADVAGVEKIIKFNVCDFQETDVPQDGDGIIFLNPEYGERMGDNTELQKTYGQIGDFLKQKCKGYTGYVFTGNPDLAKKIGLKAKRKIEFYNARIDCRLLQYELYAGTRRTDKNDEESAK